MSANPGGWPLASFSLGSWFIYHSSLRVFGAELHGDGARTLFWRVSLPFLQNSPAAFAACVVPFENLPLSVSLIHAVNCAYDLKGG